jgi:hypothetical protein
MVVIVVVNIRFPAFALLLFEYSQINIQSEEIEINTPVVVFLELKHSI